MQPSLTTLRSPRHRYDPGDTEPLRRGSPRLRTHGSDDDHGAALRVIISQSGERTGISISDLAHEGNRGGVQQDTEQELAPAGEPDEGVPRRRDVSGWTSHHSLRQLKSVVLDGGRASRPFSKDKTRPHSLQLAPTREPGPQDVGVRRDVGTPSAKSGSIGIEVLANYQRTTSLAEDVFTMEQAEGSVQPGAYPVGRTRARDDATAEGTIWRGLGSAEQANIVEGAAGHEENDDAPEDGLFSAQLVDPEADRQKLESQVERQVERMLHERLSQQQIEPDDKDSFYASCVVCGIDYSQRANQVMCVVILFLAASLIAMATVFATDVVRPQSSVVTTSPVAPAPVTVAPVSASPTTLAPLSPAPVVPSVSTQPSVYVAQWIQVGDSVSEENSEGLVAISAALSSNGTVVAVGFPGFHGIAGIRAGKVQVYIDTGESWVPRGSYLEGLAAVDYFGGSVALSADGTVLAVGAGDANGINGIDSGQVRVFNWSSTDWASMGPPIDGVAHHDNFGRAIALADDGTILAVGGLFNDAAGENAGHVQIFAWNGTDWKQTNKTWQRPLWFLRRRPVWNFGRFVVGRLHRCYRWTGVGSRVRS